MSLVAMLLAVIMLSSFALNAMADVGDGSAPEAPAAVMVPAGDLAISGTEIYLYAAPAVDAEKVMKLNPDSEVIVLSHLSAEWVKVDYQGTAGYILMANLAGEVEGSEADLSTDIEEKPTAEAPAVEEPAAEEVVVEEEPAAEEPVAEEPATEEPAAEEAVVEEEPVAEEPVAEESAAEEPAPNALNQALTDESETPEDEEPSVLIAELIDELYPDRCIKIYAYWGEKEVLYFGDSVCLTAKLIGYEGLEYNLQWKYLDNQEDIWYDLEGETEEQLNLILNEENSQWIVRVQVEITGILP
jgi:hypothetical protein